MASLFVVICTILIIFALSSSQVALGARIVHNDLTSYAETEEEILLHSHGRDSKFFDPKLANEFELIRPENIRESYENVFPDNAYVPTNGTYIIFKPKYLVINNNDVVNISFYASKPMSSDWIGAFSPAAADNITLSQTVPVKYGWCDTVYGPSYYTQKNDGRYGRGWMTFNFTNLRADISFVYFTNALKAAVVVNRSDFTVTFNNFNQPLKPRVTPTGNPDVYNISWSSYNSTSPVLKWSTAKGGPYTHTAVANTYTISKSQMRGYPANSVGWRDLGLIHTASFHGMEALSATNVYYIYGDLRTNDFSNETTLLVAPKKGDSPGGRGTRVILFDDLGRGSRDTTYTWNEYGRPSIRTAEMVGDEIAHGTVDAVYHGGDISYATGYMAVWDFYENMMAPVASGAIYLTTVGNHESDCPNSASYWNGTDSGGECGVIATTLYSQPAPSVTNKPWWSYDVGLIHFVGMSTEHNFTMGSPQWLWLKNDLENVNRSATPWVIFGGHRAMYLNSYYCCGSSTYTNPVDGCGGLDGCSPTSDIAVMHDMVTNIEPLLFANKVNFAFYGHNHVVQRQSATLNYTVIQKSNRTTINGETVNYYDDPQATVHFVIGTGGASFTKNAFYYDSPLHPVWNELYYYQYGYARVEAINATYLAYEWVLNDDGSILDRAVIRQADPFAPFDPYPSSKDDDSTSSSKPELSTPAIIAIAVLVPAVILIGVFLYYRSRRNVALADNTNFFEGGSHSAHSPVHPRSLNKVEDGDVTPLNSM